ncbi:LysR family transcriptional regulator [Myxococcus stipitatus]|uniref:LysR family transcriptional regulator n=1 Tax=Myxococcus stipitatus TaxID=83455 RepID=UPI001F1A8066|nr:LysR family transcriptional regulator [Myxococcus stipitatus]MCE9671769.1 LysR family transcriptional regulator [Myxococcus stipitatus]
MKRDPLDGVMTLLTVARLRSFRAAATELGVSPSAVSQTVRTLEARAGVALLTRTTRSVGLTEAGQRFIERAAPAIDEVLAAFDSARALGGKARGLLRLTVPRAVIPHVIEPLLPGFCAAYPEVQLEVHAADHLSHIVDEGFDAGIRLGENVEADMVAVRLTPPFGFAVFGAPAYFERRGRPRKPEDLRSHTCINYRGADGSLYRWQFSRKGQALDLAVQGSVIVNDSALNLSAAVKGLGLAYAAEPLAAGYVRQGQLERVLASYCPGTPGLFLYFPSRLQALPKLRAFIDYAREHLEPPEP